MMGDAVLINDTIWIVGGHDGASSHTNLYYGVISASSCETISWHTGDLLPFPVYHNAAGRHPGTSLLFLVGGMAYEDLPNKTCWQYSLSSAWVQFDPLPYPLMKNNSLASIGNNLFLCGGDYTGNGHPSREVWVYPALTGKGETVHKTESIGFQLSLSPNLLFQGKTAITYSVQAFSPISMKVYDSMGRVVETIIDKKLEKPGKKTVYWDGLDSENRPVPSGIYYCILKAGARTARRKMVVVR
jgi:hypothetical protein